MKACCCAPRIGSFVGLSCALVFSLALGALFWSGGADNFNRRGAEAASLFCTYPESVGGIGITEEFREANVCNNDGDPCMKDGANITADEMMGQVTGGHGFGGLLGSSLILLFIAVLIVAKVDLPKLLGITTLNDVLSLAFFAWFIGVFIWLASRALPKGGNLASDLVMITAEAVRNMLDALNPKKRED